MGYLEEEAVKTYTDIIAAIDNGAPPAAPPAHLPRKFRVSQANMQTPPAAPALNSPRARAPAGPLGKWKTEPAPEIGIAYWHLKCAPFRCARAAHRPA